jgi:hypothetical protein
MNPNRIMMLAKQKAYMRPGILTILIYGDWQLVAVAVIMDELLNPEHKWYPL